MQNASCSIDVLHTIYIYYYKYVLDFLVNFLL